MALKILNRSLTHARTRGFSVVDLLVSIAVMALLITILMPSLVSAQELSRRAKCASNVRQLGLGLQMYSYDHADLVPPSRFNALTSGGRGEDSADTIFLRVDGRDWNSENGRLFSGVFWDGLGILAKEDYADAPNVYYCPSHAGDHPISKYSDTWIQARGTVAGNYQYRIPKDSTTRLGNLKPASTLIADGMRSQADYNHRVGNNMLKADLSVQWFSDSDGSLYNMLSRDAATRPPNGVNPAWDALDHTHNSSAAIHRQ